MRICMATVVTVGSVMIFVLIIEGAELYLRFIPVPVKRQGHTVPEGRYHEANVDELSDHYTTRLLIDSEPL